MLMNVSAQRLEPVTPGSNLPERNPGMELDLGWLEEMRAVNRSALERRVQTLTRRRSVKGEAQAAWLLKALACMDLTSLNSNDTDIQIQNPVICVQVPRCFRRSGSPPSRIWRQSGKYAKS